jgi:hypothetical protein
MTDNPDQPVNDREERIRLLAYRLWEEEGYPDGKNEEHWRQACAILLAEENELTVSVWLKKTDRPPANVQPETASAARSGDPAVLRRAKVI